MDLIRLGVRAVVIGFVVSISGAASAVPAAEVKIVLPQNRTAFQTNEWIDVSVVRRGMGPLTAGPLVLTLMGADGSSIGATFAAPAVGVQGNEARATEHLHMNGWLMRPGKYAIEVAADGAKATSEIEVFSHVRQSSFRLINWGRANNREQQIVQGEDSLGFNLFYGGYDNDDQAHFIRAGVDFMANCVMSGGHQMDLRLECDWSDPYVTRGGTRRVARRAMIDRNRPNVPGVHFYDEPGLTWFKHPVTGEFGPHGVPGQVRSYIAAFGREPIAHYEVDPNNPDHVARWKHWAAWKLGLMDAAWKEAQFGVSAVRSDFLSLTQSVYGWTAFTDGYYFNVARSLPITSGHGGYHDIGPGYFCPSYFLEMARARDRWKPTWYLPTWYGNTTADQFRLEQYLSFQTHVQGLMSPPDCEPAVNAGPRQGIVESNHLLKKLGTIFTTMPPTRPPVAVLYSLSQAVASQVKDRTQNYAHALPHGQNLPLTYVALKLIGQQFDAVVDEDAIDGTLGDYRAVVLTSLDYVAPAVVAALEDFAKRGGLVLLTADSAVQIGGAVKLSAAPRMPDQAKIDELMKAAKYGELGPFTTTGKHIEGATPLAQALRAELAKAGIAPVFDSDVPTIVATRQAAGDIEYLFAVNATYDAAAKDDKGNAERNALKATAAKITLADDGRAIYDAIHSRTLRGAVAKDGLAAAGGKLAIESRFGPGQMRVFARTARPIGGVRAAAPVVRRELVRETEPITVQIAASLMDDQGRLLSGSAPLHVRVIDPLGVTRHELYRATTLGTFTTTLPLAANDPAGDWKVIVRELLAGTEDAATFGYTPPTRPRAIAGATPRAVYAGNDRDNAFRFARLHHDVTIIMGASPFNAVAADRLTKSLEPWGVRCKVMDLAEASKARRLSEDEAKTWVGLQYAGSGQIKAGDANPPVFAGFAVQGPVILLGNPEDNPIIKFLLSERFLPYTPHPTDLPGPSRGFMAWQRDGVGAGQESITLIAYDEAGMGEAVGTFYEAVAGTDGLTKWTLPQSDQVVASKAAPGRVPAAVIAWQAVLPDRVVSLKTEGANLVAITADGSTTTLDASGKIVSTQPAEVARAAAPASVAIPDVFKPVILPDRLIKLVVAGNNETAVGYWGGTLQVIRPDGSVKSQQVLPHDVTALVWQGSRAVAGLADGRTLAIE
jgi:hypothetical protein